ncbi:hypothetical protein MRB53_036931 [Persea americana]|nr:hypothetical protein MRB53_036931 [Persea americana]
MSDSKLRRAASSDPLHSRSAVVALSRVRPPWLTVMLMLVSTRPWIRELDSVSAFTMRNAMLTWRYDAVFLHI